MITQCKSYNVQIYCGLKEQYDGIVHNLEEVRQICQKYVDTEKSCITLTSTEFFYVKGNEPGFIVGFINYPRFPATYEEINDKAIKLAKELMISLKQYRVTITTPNNSIMLTNNEL